MVVVEIDVDVSVVVLGVVDVDCTGSTVVVSGVEEVDPSVAVSEVV